jgi:hypothetical protein
MKTNFRTIALAALVAIASMSPALQAQTTDTYAQINVPFAFDYGTAHFAPGTYRIDMRSTKILAVHNGSRTGMAMVQTEYNHFPVKTGQVFFEKYGDRYFLQEVWTAGSDTHLSVYQSKREKQAAKELASQGTAPNRIALALLAIPSTTTGN